MFAQASVAEVGTACVINNHDIVVITHCDFELYFAGKFERLVVPCRGLFKQSDGTAISDLDHGDPLIQVIDLTFGILKSNRSFFRREGWTFQRTAMNRQHNTLGV